MGFNPLEYLEECNRWQIRLDLEQRRGEQLPFVSGCEETHQTGTVDETGLVGYVHWGGLVQEAGIDDCNFCILLIDIIANVKEFTGGF